VTLDDLRVKAKALRAELERVQDAIRRIEHEQWLQFRRERDSAIRSAALRNNVQGDERG
jgi:hypothetical protein